MDKWERLKQELKREIEKNKEIAKRITNESVKFDIMNEAVILSQVLMRMEELEEEVMKDGAESK